MKRKPPSKTKQPASSKQAHPDAMALMAALLQRQGLRDNDPNVLDAGKRLEDHIKKTHPAALPFLAGTMQGLGERDGDQNLLEAGKRLEEQIKKGTAPHG